MHVVCNIPSLHGITIKVVLETQAVRIIRKWVVCQYNMIVHDL